MNSQTKISGVFVSIDFIRLLSWSFKWNTQLCNKKIDKELGFRMRLKISTLRSLCMSPSIHKSDSITPSDLPLTT